LDIVESFAIAAYISPEILLGLPYTLTVDLWSIGCLLYMLVAGYPPFQAPHHRALFRKIRAADFVFHEQYWGNVSIEAKQLIAHLLTVNVAKRWTADQALQCDWFQKVKAGELKQNDLSGSLDEMKKFDAKDAWKRAFHAIGFCATAAFWKPDIVSFSQQIAAWDDQLSNSVASTGTSEFNANLMNKLPKLKFEDRYEVLRQLRKGSFATVWECRHVETQTMYAVKIIQRKNLQPRDDEAVLNEVAVMQALTGNQYCVQLLDFYEQEDAFYLIMEYCTGGDVFDKIVALTQYTEKDARELAITLLKAVGSIHKAGFAHRDIKPQNLLLLDKTNNYNIRIADFGFARRVHTPESLTRYALT
jgi:serine/threonine protein kinase